MSTSVGPVCGTGGLRFLADRTIFEPDEPIDTLLVGGDPSFDVIDPPVVHWLRRRAPQVRRYGSVCTGVFLLAAAGLLDGKRVTTHWECAARLRSEFPDLDIDADQIFIQDGALYTTAGVTAGMDLALAMVEEDYGRESCLDRRPLHGDVFEATRRPVAIQRSSRGSDVRQDPDLTNPRIRDCQPHRAAFS